MNIALLVVYSLILLGFSIKDFYYLKKVYSDTTKI